MRSTVVVCRINSFNVPSPKQISLSAHHFHTHSHTHTHTLKCTKKGEILNCKMPKYQTLFLILLVLSILELNTAKPGDFDAMVKRVCVGKIGECSTMAAEEEMMVDSESNRRTLLMQKNYISYDTLRRDLVPCDKPGASYYNCKGPGVANSYSRGCEIITRCARGD